MTTLDSPTARALLSAQAWRPDDHLSLLSERQIETSLNHIKSQLARLQTIGSRDVSDTGADGVHDKYSVRLRKDLSKFNEAMTSAIRQLEDGNVRDVDDVLIASLKSKKGVPGDSAMLVRDILRLVDEAVTTVVETGVRVSNGDQVGDDASPSLDTLTEQLRLADVRLLIAGKRIPSRLRRCINVMWRAVREWAVAVCTLSCFGEKRDTPQCMRKPKPDWDVLRHTVALVQTQRFALTKHACNATESTRAVRDSLPRYVVTEWDALGSTVTRLSARTRFPSALRAPVPRQSPKNK